MYIPREKDTFYFLLKSTLGGERKCIIIKIIYKSDPISQSSAPTWSSCASPAFVFSKSGCVTATTTAAPATTKLAVVSVDKPRGIISFSLCLDLFQS